MYLSVWHLGLVHHEHLRIKNIFVNWTKLSLMCVRCYDKLRSVILCGPQEEVEKSLLFIVALLLCTFIYGWVLDKKGVFIILALSWLVNVFLSHNWSCFILCHWLKPGITDLAKLCCYWSLKVVFIRLPEVWSGDKSMHYSMSESTFVPYALMYNPKFYICTLGKVSITVT